MDYWAFQHAVVARVDARLAALARRERGAKKRIAAEIGVKPGFFSEMRKHAQRIPMDKYFRLLKALGEHPAEFFYETARQVDPRLRPISDEWVPTLDSLPAGHVVRRILGEAEDED